jgi:hypothetical protein
VGDAEMLREGDALRALAGARSAEQHETHD